MGVLPSMTESEYIRRVETVDECVMFLVNIVAEHCSDKDKREMFENFKQIALKQYRESYIKYLNSHN